MNYLILVLASAAAYIISALSNIITTKLGSLRDPLQTWEILNTVGLLPIRLRAWIFSTLVGIANPYSRSINFRITELRKGKACGVLRVNYVDFFFLLCPWRTLSRQMVGRHERQCPKLVWEGGTAAKLEEGGPVPIDNWMA